VGYEEHVTCTSPVVNLQPGMTTSFPVRVLVWAAQVNLDATVGPLVRVPQVCEVPNDAEIWTPGIGDSNTSPTDDRASAVAFLPREGCIPPPAHHG
jgi:hypothetical protein